MAEQQLNLIKKGVGRGGSRSGAGRKRSTEGSKVVRVPEPYMKAVKALIEFLGKAEEIEHVERRHVIESKTVYASSHFVDSPKKLYRVKFEIEAVDTSYKNQNKPTETPE